MGDSSQSRERGAATVEHVALAALIAMLVAAGVGALAGAPPGDSARELGGTIARRIACAPRHPVPCGRNPLALAYGFPLGAQIDHVLVSEDFSVRSARFLDLADTDHRALLVGLELHVTEWQCKIKLNQHRPESHAALHAGYAAGTPPEQELARWMEQLGMFKP